MLPIGTKPEVAHFFRETVVLLWQRSLHKITIAIGKQLKLNWLEINNLYNTSCYMDTLVSLRRNVGMFLFFFSPFNKMRRLSHKKEFATNVLVNNSYVCDHLGSTNKQATGESELQYFYSNIPIGLRKEKKPKQSFNGNTTEEQPIRNGISKSHYSIAQSDEIPRKSR